MGLAKKGMPEEAFWWLMKLETEEIRAETKIIAKVVKKQRAPKKVRLLCFASLCSRRRFAFSLRKKLGRSGRLWR